MLLTWIGFNSFVLIKWNKAFDPNPYILLNLMLSMIAAFQAPIIMMSQNRQTVKDRADAEHDYEVNLKAELEMLNPATISYLLGAAGVRFSGFMIACLALTPNLAIEVYFGHVGKHAARLVGSDARTAHLHNLAIIGGLAVCIAVMVLVSKMARKAVMRAVAETEKAGGSAGG